jgi:hypothetical protein
MKNTRQLLPMTLAMVAALGSLSAAQAGDISHLGSLNQTEFFELSKDLAAATTHQPMEPAAPLGLTGFDISVATSMTNTRAGSAWNTATGDSMGQLLQGKVMATKGLPWGVDVGGFVSKSPNTNVSASGFHVKYALLEGGVALPAVAVRTSYSRLGGVSQMDLNNTAVDVLISKGFVGLTPYAGVGAVHSNAKVNGLNNINNESFTQSKSFVGVSMNMLLVNLSAEYARVGSASTIGVKAGLRY